MKITRFYVKERVLKDGTRSLLLCNSCHGKTRSVPMGLYLEPASTKGARHNNELRMMQARRIVAKAELEQSEHVFQLPRIYTPQLLCEAWKTYELSYRHTDAASVRAMGKWLARFCGNDYGTLYLHELTTEWVQRMEIYLHSHLHGETPTAYFKKFKNFLAHHVRLGTLRDNPASAVHTTTSNAITKNVLTLNDLQILAETECVNLHVKLAFLFACNTGMRWCDIVRLCWKDYDASHATIHFVQNKVEGKSSRDAMHQPLNRNALIILETIRQHSAGPNMRCPVFDLPSYRTTLRHLKSWMAAAGIRKHITFHCARHTFITNLILLDTNIAMVAQLAGHSSSRHTERYIHLADKERAQAINRLPTYNLQTRPTSLSSEER